MDHLSKLTLKGYFEKLRSEVGELSGVRKEAVKSGAQPRSKSDPTHKLLELLIKAVAMVEEIHSSDSEFLHEDHLNDYRSMIVALNDHGIAYKGNQEILGLKEKPSLDLTGKKPMQKANPKSKAKNSSGAKRKAG